MTRRRAQDASQQLDLLDAIEQLGREVRPDPGSLNVDVRLRSTLSEAIRRCSLSRFQVAAQMSEAMGVEVTKFQLDAWTAESKEGHRFPASYLPAFCAAVGDWSPMKVLAQAGGHRLDTDPNIDIATQIGELDAEIRAMEARLREKRRVHSQAVQFWNERRNGASRG